MNKQSVLFPQDMACCYIRLSRQTRQCAEWQLLTCSNLSRFWFCIDQNKGAGHHQTVSNARMRLVDLSFQHWIPKRPKVAGPPAAGAVNLTSTSVLCKPLGGVMRLFGGKCSVPGGTHCPSTTVAGRELADGSRQPSRNSEQLSCGVTQSQGIIWMCPSHHCIYMLDVYVHSTYSEQLEQEYDIPGIAHNSSAQLNTL